MYIKWAQKHREIIVGIISYLFILLFVYAAVSKLLDFENFRVQLGQSPMLSVYAGWISWVVPLTELLISLLLLFSATRLWGLFAAFGMMLTFAAYIYIILNYSSFIPCSCGGILEKLGWREHFIFNLVFVALALIGVFISTHRGKPKYPISGQVTLIWIFSLTFICIGTVAFLFTTSENAMQNRNPFIRRFPNKVIKIFETNLKFNSYYVAGAANGKIYLGNYTAPLHVTVLDTALNSKKEYIIKIAEQDMPSISAQVRVFPPYFYLIDGTLPVIFKGPLRNWKALPVWEGDNTFSHYQMMDSITLAFRAIDNKAHHSILGTLYFGNPPKIQLNTNLLEKQVDGIFDVDGTLRYDVGSKRLVYTYLYRNQYIVADHNLKLQYRGNTIDTTAHAQIQVTYIASKKQWKLATPPLKVNTSTAIWNHSLFVQSTLPGRFEPIEMWKEASIIDVYNLDDGTYDHSFYVYDNKGKKLKHFFIIDGLFYGFVGSKLVCYKVIDTI